MKELWRNLQPREQRILLGGAVAMILLLIYLLAWEPYQKEMARLRESVAAKRVDLQVMQQAAAEIEALRRSGAGGQLPAGQSIMGVVDSSAKRFNVGAGIKRIQPEGERSVKVWAEQVPFDDLIRWLDELQKSSGIIIYTLSIERQETNGLVNVRMELRSGA
ncbi:MAG TPA: type II secretion system protein M [Gammaproteobacteria bacterium]